MVAQGSSLLGQNPAYRPSGTFNVRAEHNEFFTRWPLLPPKLKHTCKENRSPVGIEHIPLRKRRFRTPLDFISRNAPRMVCSFDTVMATADNPALPVRIFNFSEAGFMIACPATLNSGAEITLSLHGLGDTPARILWARNSQAGGRFKDPIDVEKLISEVEALKQT